MVMNWLRRIMMGRYGIDPLGYALLGASLLCLLLRGIVRYGFAALLSLLAVVCLGFCYYRVFSRNFERRRMENERFLLYWGPALQWFRGRGAAFHELQNFKHLKCPRCGQKIRIPRGRGKVSITCPSCREPFVKKV